MTTRKVRPVPAFTGARIDDPDLGVVQYDVAGVGCYSLRWDDDYAYRDLDRGLSVHITYGRWPGTDWPHMYHWPDRPTLFGVEVAGGAVVNVAKAMDVAARGATAVYREYRWVLQVHAARYNPERTGGVGSITPGAEEWNTRIVAALVADYATRADADETLYVHQRNKAPARLQLAQKDRATCLDEIVEWQKRLHRQDGLIARHTALLNGSDVVPDYPLAMPARDERHALTDGGRWFLRCTDKPARTA